MKVNRLFVVLFSSVMIFAAAVAAPAPKAGVVKAAEAAEIQENTEEQGEEAELTEEERAVKEATEARLALQKDPNHVHHFKWIAKMNESESAEGTINYMCTECDKVWYFRPIAPYYAFEGDVARRIEVAPEGATVRVKTSLFINFNKQVMEALAKRPDVSVYVSFLDQEYKGNRVSFVIPAGEDTMSLLDEQGYAGFIYLGNKYGLKMEVPMTVDNADDEVAEENSSTDAQTEKTKQ